MSYEQVQKMLIQYAQHNEQGFRNQMFMKQEFELAFPTIQGPSGIGKTESVKRFAKEKGLLLKLWDAEGMGLQELSASLSEFTARFMKAKEEGAIFLIERFNHLDVASIHFLKDYVRGQATASIRTVDGGMEEIVVKRTPNLNLVAEVTKD